ASSLVVLSPDILHNIHVRVAIVAHSSNECAPFFRVSVDCPCSLFAVRSEAPTMALLKIPTAQGLCPSFTSLSHLAVARRSQSRGYLGQRLTQMASMYDEAQAEIFRIMDHECFARYLRSPMFRVSFRVFVAEWDMFLLVVDAPQAIKDE